MKYGTQWNKVVGTSRDEGLARARALGCSGLEVSIPVGSLRTGEVTVDELKERAQTTRAALGDADLEAVSLSPGVGLKHAETNPEVVDAVGEVAEALGTSVIRLFFSPHVRLGGPHKALDDFHAEFDGTLSARERMRRDADRLARMVERTAPWGLRLAFELHHGYTVNSASAAMRMLEGYSPRHVGVIMDPGNMVFEGNEGWRCSTQILGDYLAYIHCKNACWRWEDGAWRHQWASLEEGVASFPELITALQDEGWNGYLVIEDLRKSVDSEEAVGGGIRYLRSLVESEQRVTPV